MRIKELFVSKSSLFSSSTNEGGSSSSSERAISNTLLKRAAPLLRPQEKCGLKELSSPPASSITVDVVAVHGLNGDAIRTWTDRETSALWLRDFLPRDLPGARVTSFDYDSKVAFSNSKADLDDFALDLLDRVQALRNIKQANRIPLVFVCHSLGGIVVKKALILSHESQDHYGDILKSCSGIIFLGTPHRGSKTASWAATLGKIVNSLTSTAIVRTDLLRNLQSKSEGLQSVSRQFVHRAKDIAIVSFYETKPTLKASSALIVDRDSATMGVPTERIVPSAADHRVMCTFPSGDSSRYQPVARAIIDIAGSHESASSDVSILSQPVPPGNLPGKVLQADHDDEVHDDHESDEELFLRTDYEFPDPAVLDNSSNARSFSENSATITIVFRGLHQPISKRGRTIKLSSDEVTLPYTTLLTDLPKALSSRGWKSPHYFTFCDRAIRPTWKDVFTEKVLITSGPSGGDAESGRRINLNDTLASFFAHSYPSSVKTALQRDSQKPKSKSQPDPVNLRVTTNGSRAFDISFHRTVRVPDDGKVHKLPPGLGKFPLFNIQSFRDRLPSSMLAKGGIFFPLYQREAMWVHFRSEDKSNRYVIRPFVGGVNAISGDSAEGSMANLLAGLTAGKREEKQDYLVLPDQPWLDGICTEPGVVKQFVSTPMLSLEQQHERNVARKMLSAISTNSKTTAHTSGSFELGASIELQMTGQDRCGGIQLLIVPEHDWKRMSFCLNEDSYIIGERHVSINGVTVPLLAGSLNVECTPKELGLREGSWIHVKDISKISPDRPKTIRDLHSEAPPEAINNGQIFLNVGYSDHRALLHISSPESGSGGEFEIEVEVDDDLHELERLLSSSIFPSADKGLALHMPNPYHSEPIMPIRSMSDLFDLAIAAHRIQDYNEVLKGKDLVSFNLTWCKNAAQLNAYVLNAIFPHKYTDQDTVSVTFRPWGCVMAHHLMPATSLSYIEDLARSAIGSYTRIASPAPNTFGSGKALLYFMKSVGPPILKGPLVFTVRTTTGKSFVIRDMIADDTTFAIKCRLQELDGIQMHIQRLTYLGTELADDVELRKYHIRPNSVIHLVFRLRGGGSKTYSVYQSDGTVHRIDSNYFESWMDLKWMLYKRTGIHPSQMELIHNNQILNDDGDPLLRFRLDPPKLRLLDKSEHNVALSVGAGGNIKQSIIADSNDPRLWDTSSAKLINIQLINSVAFELVTGRATPPTPISYQTYAMAGLPFYDIYRERPTSAFGNFGKVKTISQVDAEQDAELGTKFNPLNPSVCAVCTTTYVDTVNHPCGHGVCSQCAQSKSGRCSICKTKVGRHVALAGTMGPSWSETEGTEIPVVMLKNIEGFPPFKSVVKRDTSKAHRPHLQSTNW